MSYYTVFNDDDECHKVYSIYDENGNFLTNWENGYCYFPDNIYKDEEGHILVPDQNRTLSLNNGDYYKIEQWRAFDDSNLDKLPILTFAKINDLLASEWLKYEPNKFYHFNSYALYINNNNAHLISKKFQVDDIIHIGETVEDIRKRNTRALGAFLSIVNANGQLSL